MPPKQDVARFKRNQKVVAAVDLPGVPLGTPGKVQLVNGLSWIRYWVHFDNDIALGQIDGDQLAAVDDWKSQEQARVRAARAAERETQRQAILEQVAASEHDHPGRPADPAPASSV